MRQFCHSLLTVMVVLRSFVPIGNKHRRVIQDGTTGFQPVIPVGWASSPSIRWGGQEASYQNMTGNPAFCAIIFGPL
jgi:hypothetical protein